MCINADPNGRLALQRQYDALVQAVREMLPPDDATATFELAANIHQTMLEDVERNRSRNDLAK